MPFATDRRRRIDAMIDYFGEGRARAPWSGLPSQHEDDRRRGPGLGEVDVWVVKVLGPDDADGAERLVERCGDLVYRWALCLTGVKEDAEEVAEEVLRTPADLIHTFASPSAFGSWLFRAGLTRRTRSCVTASPDVKEIAFDPSCLGVDVPEVQLRWRS